MTRNLEQSSILGGTSASEEIAEEQPEEELEPAPAAENEEKDKSELAEEFRIGTIVNQEDWNFLSPSQVKLNSLAPASTSMPNFMRNRISK